MEKTYYIEAFQHGTIIEIKDYTMWFKISSYHIQ